MILPQTASSRPPVLSFCIHGQSSACMAQDLDAANQAVAGCNVSRSVSNSIACRQRVCCPRFKECQKTILKWFTLFCHKSLALYARTSLVHHSSGDHQQLIKLMLRIKFLKFFVILYDCRWQAFISHCIMSGHRVLIIIVNQVLLFVVEIAWVHD